jgi:hypothetical protein
LDTEQSRDRQAFSESKMNDDPRKYDVPALILHGNFNQIMPARNAYRSSKLSRLRLA